MANEFLARPRRLRRLIPVAVLALAMLVGAAVLLAAHRPTNRPPAAASTPGPAGTGGSLASGSPSASAALPLVPGTGTVNGVAVGYPHQLVGAVSAAVEYWTQIGSTLASDRAAAIGSAVADPSWPHAADDFARGPVNSRRAMALPLAGPLPDGVSLVLSALQYQVRQPSADRVVVLLLGYLTLSTPTGGVTNRVGVFPALMHWAGGDWKMARLGPGADYSHLNQQPETPAAAAAGWLDLQY